MFVNEREEPLLAQTSKPRWNTLVWSTGLDSNAWEFYLHSVSVERSEAPVKIAHRPQESSWTDLKGKPSNKAGLDIRGLSVSPHPNEATDRRTIPWMCKENPFVFCKHMKISTTYPNICSLINSALCNILTCRGQYLACEEYIPVHSLPSTNTGILPSSTI